MMGRIPGTQEKKKSSENVSAKNVVLRRRKQGLFKKAKELSILCGIPILLTVRSPDGELEVWPSDPSLVKSILENYVNITNPEKNPPIKSQVQDDEINNLGIVKGKGLSTDNQVEEQQMGCGYQLVKNSGEKDDMWDGIEYGLDDSTMMMMSQNEQNICGERAELIEGSTSAGSFFCHKQGWETLGMNFDDVMLPPPQPRQICYPEDNGVFDLDNYLELTNGNDEKLESFGNVNPDFDDVMLPPPQPKQFCYTDDYGIFDLDNCLGISNGKGEKLESFENVNPDFDDVTLPSPQSKQFSYPEDYGIFDLDNCLGLTNGNDEKIESFDNVNLDFGIDDYVYDASTQSMVPTCFPLEQSMVPLYLPVF